MRDGAAGPSRYVIARRWAAISYSGDSHAGRHSIGAHPTLSNWLSNHVVLLGDVVELTKLSQGVFRHTEGSYERCD